MTFPLTALRFLLLVALLLPAMPGSAEHRAARGSRFMIDLPSDYKSSPDFAGFLSERDQAAIIINELPDSLITLQGRHSDEQLRGNRLSNIRRENFEREGLRVELIRAEQTVRGRAIAKWYYLTGDGKESVSVAISFPQNEVKTVGAMLLDALEGAYWDTSLTLDHFDGLGFRMDEVPGLRVSSRVRNTLVLTRDGRLPDLYYTGPMLLAGWANLPDDVSADTQRAFARHLFDNITLLSESELDNLEPVVLDSLSGFELQGTGRHRYLGYPIAVLQVVAFKDGRYFLAQGFTETRRSSEHFDLFRSVIGTFREN